MPLKKSDRESLRLKMVEHQNKAASYRNKINLIDKQNEQAYRDSIIKKCFKMNAGSKKEPSWHGYFRVEYFDKINLQPHGTKIDIYDQFENEDGKTFMSVELNTRGFEDWIKNGQKISNKEFEKMITRVHCELLKIE